MSRSIYGHVRLDRGIDVGHHTLHEEVLQDVVGLHATGCGQLLDRDGLGDLDGTLGALMDDLAGTTSLRAILAMPLEESTGGVQSTISFEEILISPAATALIAITLSLEGASGSAVTTTSAIGSLTAIAITITLRTGATTPSSGRRHVRRIVHADSSTGSRLTALR